VDLTFQKPGDHLFVRSVSEAGIQVVDNFYRDALILSANEIIADWPVKSVEDIEQKHLEQVLKLEPEVVLIGTGARQIFLPPALMMFFYSRNIGIEVMTTDAACRTFNVLVSESRRVVAALIPERQFTESFAPGNIPQL
jgi:uncharacterized protein